MMDIFSFLSLSEDIDFWAYLSLTMNLRQLSLHIESKTSEFLDVDRSSGSDIVSNVFNKCFPDYYELCLWLKWLQVWGCSLSRLIMLTWIFVPVCKDPDKDLGKNKKYKIETYQSIICSMFITFF
jgi:hypothetical protein